MLAVNFISNSQLDESMRESDGQLLLILKSHEKEEEMNPYAFEQGVHLYEETETASILKHLLENTSKQIDSYNKETFSDIIEKIIKLDSNIYDNIIVAIYSLLQAKDTDAQTEFASRIVYMFSNTNSDEKKEEEIDIADAAIDTKAEIEEESEDYEE